MKKKGSWLKIAAILAAVIGGIVAIAAFMKKKGKKIREELEFDDEQYFGEENDFTDDIMNGDETVEAAPSDEAASEEASAEAATEEESSEEE